MLPRTTGKLSANAVSQITRQSALTNIAMLSSLNHISSIHTKKQQIQSPTQKIKKSGRWFSAIPMPSLSSSISPITESIGMFTGNASMANKNNRVMQRVWQKRQQRLMKATSHILERFKTGNLKFESAEIYIRAAGSFDDSEDNGQREVHIALRGIAHTVVVLKTGDQESYLLDRVVEGIRLTELKINQKTQKIEQCNKFKPDEMVKLSTYKNIDLSSNKIAEWINKESQTEYNVISNNCVWFSAYFYQNFLAGLKVQQLIESFRGKK